MLCASVPVTIRTPPIKMHPIFLFHLPISDYFQKEVLSLMIPKCLVQKERKLEVWIIRKPTMIPPSSMVFVYVIANGLVFVQYLTTCPVLSCLCPVFIHLPSIVLVFVQYLSTCPGQSRGKDLCEEANLPRSSFSAGSRAPPGVSTYILSTQI